jgi:hypothetical protein
MRYFNAIAALLVAGISVAGSISAAEEGPWASVWDGKSLQGWHQVGDGQWVIEDGAIVGKTDKAAKLYGLLVSDQTYKNFTVRFKFKSLKGNSGFYIRTIIEKPDMAKGLQIEIDPRSSTGGIYESYGRAWIDQPKAELVKSCYKLDDWNEMEVSADGGHVVVKLNGAKTAELLNDPSRPEGRLAFQMHAGNEMLVMFKDIEINVKK